MHIILIIVEKNKPTMCDKFQNLIIFILQLEYSFIYPILSTHILDTYIYNRNL